METEAIRRYMLNKKVEVRKLALYPREFSINPTKNFITTLIGARRVGKTYMVLDLMLNKLKLQNDDFLYLNFEDVELNGIKADEILNFINVHQQIYNKLPSFIFMDEPQELNRWEKVVYSLYEKKLFNIIITGSSSKLLSKEIATSLRGRSLTYIIYPLSFKEYLSFNSLGLKSKELMSDYDINKLLHELFAYLTTGSMPDIALNKSISENFYRDYINLVIFKDIVERFGIKNIFVVQFLIKALITSFSKKISVNSLYNQLKATGQKVSKKTLYSYIALLEDSFFSFRLRKFSFSNNTSELSTPKTYLNDWGLASAIFDLNSEIGRLMENCVFVELKRRGEDKRIYYSDIGNDIDFVLQRKGKVEQLLQVTYASKRDEINSRETESLIKGAGALKCENLLVITWSYEAEEKIEGKRIKFIPLWKWLLNI